MLFYAFLLLIYYFQEFSVEGSSNPHIAIKFSILCFQFQIFSYHHILIASSSRIIGFIL